MYWQVEFKLEDRDRLGPRLYRRGLHGQPKTIVKTKLGTQDVAQFTVDNIIQCPKDNGYGELPEELGQEALDNYFDMRQGKAESIPDYIFREEILTVAFKKDTAIDLDEKIRGYWLVRTSNLTEREISGIKIITQWQSVCASKGGAAAVVALCLLQDRDGGTTEPKALAFPEHLPRKPWTGCVHRYQKNLCN